MARDGRCTSPWRSDDGQNLLSPHRVHSNVGAYNHLGLTAAQSLHPSSSTLPLALDPLAHAFLGVRAIQKHIRNHYPTTLHPYFPPLSLFPFLLLPPYPILSVIVSEGPCCFLPIHLPTHPRARLSTRRFILPLWGWSTPRLPPLTNIAESNMPTRRASVDQHSGHRIHL